MRTHRYFLTLMGAVVLVHGLLFVHVLRDFPDIGSTADSQYRNISAHLVREGVYSAGARDAAGDLVSTASQPPLYTLLYAGSYAIFGIGPMADRAMQVLLTLANVGVIVVVWHIGRLFSPRAAHAAATVAVLDLTAFFFAQNYDIPDTLVGFFLALWLYHLVRLLRGASPYRAAAWSGVFLGCAMLTKIGPFLLWVPLAGMLAAFLWTSGGLSRVVALRTFGIFVLVIMLFFGGWKLRNLIVTGSGTFASGATTLQWNTSHLIAYQQGISFAEARKQITERYVPDTLLAQGEGAVEREVSRALVGLILASPIDFSVVVLRAMPGFFLGTFPPYMLFSRDTANVLRATVEASHGHRALLAQLWADGRIGYVFIYAFAKLHLVFLYGAALVAVVAFAWRRELWWTLATFAMTTAYVVAVSGASAQARYRTMLFPIIYVLGGYGVVVLLGRWKSRIHRVRSIPASAPSV